MNSEFRFSYEVKAQIELMEPELDVLMELALHHRDRKCRSTATAGPGAFLNGMKTDFEYPDEPPNTVTSYLTFGQIDTLCKVLEDRQFLIGRARVLAQGVHVGLRAAIEAIRKERDRLRSMPEHCDDL